MWEATFLQICAFKIENLLPAPLYGMTWLVLFFVLTVCDDQKREYKGRRNQSSQIKMIFAVPFNTESHNAWRFHKLITGFFWRRELGLPVIAYAVLFTSSYRKKEAKQTSDSVRQLFLAFPHANNLQRLFFPNQELTRNQLVNKASCNSLLISLLNLSIKKWCGVMKF